MIQEKTGQTNGSRPARSRNNTERKRAEQQLRDAKEFAEGLLAAMRDGLSVLDSRGIHVHVNSALCDMTGFSSEELIGAGPPHPYWPPEELEQIERAFQKTMGSQFEDFQLTFMRKNGERFPVIVSPSRTKDQQGNVVHYFATVKDITERKRAEEASRRRTHELGERFKELTCLRRLSNLLQKPGISVDEILRGTTALLRPAWQYPETACGRIILGGREFTTENFRETRWRQASDIVVHGERSGIVEVCYLEERPESDEGPFLKQERILIDAIAERLGRVVERKRAEEALQRSEATYRSIFNATNDGILVLDTETGEIVDANATICNVFGYTPEEVRGLFVGDISSGQAPYIQEGALRLIQEAAGGERQHFEWLAKARDGSLLWIDVNLKHATIAGQDRVLAVGRDITQRKRAEEALRESETKFRTLTETAAASIFIYRGTTPLYVNATMETLTGYTREEILAGELWRLAHPDFQSLVRERSRARQQGEEAPSRYEFKIVRKSGEERWVDFTAGMIEFEGQTAVIGTAYDITERKRAEDELRRLEHELALILNSMSEPVMHLDRKMRVVWANRAAAEAVNSTPQELVGRHCYKIWQQRGESCEGCPVPRALTTGQPQQGEVTLSNGGAWLMAASPVRDADGRVVGAIEVANDLTERKQAEEALRASEATYREIFNATNDGIVVHDMETGEIVDANAAFLERHGCTTEEARQLNVVPLGSDEAPYTQEDALRWIHKAARGEPQRFEWQTKDRDGRHIWLDMTLKRATIAGQDRVLAISRDITEHRRAEEALRESEARFRTLMETTAASVFIYRGTRPLYINAAMERLTGYTREEILARELWQLVHPDFQSLVRERSRARQQGEQPPSRYEFKIVTKSGDERWVDFTAGIIELEGHRAAIGTFYDITERKQAEEALQESEERYRLLAENARDVIWTTDMDLNFTYLSPSAAEMRGTTSEQPMAQRVEEVLTPASLEIAAKAVAEELTIETMDEKDLSRSRTLELELYRRDGSTVWIETKMTFQRDPGGRPVGILGVSRDITERKQADEALRETRDYLEKLIDYANAPIIVWDPDFTITRFNHAFERLTGRPAGEVVGQRLEVLFPEAERAASMEQIARTLRGDFWELIEISILHQNGEVRRVLWNSANIAGPDGRTVVATIAQGTDITERKQAEEALRESEQRFRTLSEASFEAIAIHRKGTMLEANQALAAMFGYELSEAIKMHVLDFVAPESRDAVLQSIVSKSREPFEFTGLKKDGTTFPVEVCGRPIPYQGKMVTVAALRDITEHKQAEEALQKAREELENRVERQMERGNPYGLTFRELTVLHVVAAGKADKEIGSQLGISTLTASKHLANILNKMGAASRTEASVRALREGLLD